MSLTWCTEVQDENPAIQHSEMTALSRRTTSLWRTIKLRLFDMTEESFPVNMAVKQEDIHATQLMCTRYQSNRKK